MARDQDEVQQEWLQAGSVDDFVEGEGRCVHLAGQPIAVFLFEQQFFALHDVCPHGDARLSEGFVENGCVECPFHQAQFDLRSGAVLSPPATEDVRSYPIRIVDGIVEVAL